MYGYAHMGGKGVSILAIGPFWILFFIKKGI
jgi:hypothetical protein